MEKIKRIGIDGKEHTYIVYSEDEVAIKKAEFQKRRNGENKHDNEDDEEQS